ncbi:MAG: cob(I)yrinic acid a,c-diamide adenosyltransferase [Stellaceae bacterium]
MVKLDRIYTGGGDRGETSLTGGARVPKHAARIEALGAVDEANAALGLARLAASGEAGRILARVQNDLFDLGADLSTPMSGNKAEGALRILTEQVSRLEREIDNVNAGLPPLTSFVLPGGRPASAYLHVARTVVRRAERAVSALAAAEPIGPEALRYLNRLSDLLFVMGRDANDQGSSDVLWQPGAFRS